MCPSGLLVFVLLSLLYFHVSDVSVQDDVDDTDLSVLEEFVDVEVLESGDWVSFLRELLERNVDTTLHHKPDRRAYHPVVDVLFRSVEDAEVLVPDPI